MVQHNTSKLKTLPAGLAYDVGEEVQDKSSNGEFPRLFHRGFLQFAALQDCLHGGWTWWMDGWSHWSGSTSAFTHVDSRDVHLVP